MDVSARFPLPATAQLPRICLVLFVDQFLPLAPALMPAGIPLAGEGGIGAGKAFPSPAIGVCFLGLALEAGADAFLVDSLAGHETSQCVSEDIEHASMFDTLMSDCQALTEIIFAGMVNL